MKRKITLDGRFSRSVVTMLAFFLAALLFSSCEKEDASEPAVLNTENMKNARLSPINNSAGDNISRPLVPAEAMVYIQHGTCSGNCPVYSVTLTPHGTVNYTGIRNVGTMGTVTFQVNRDVAYGIVAEMVNSGFLDLRDFYPPGGSDTDAPMTVTALRMGESGDKLKVVVDYGYQVPATLSALRQQIETQLGIDRLVRAGRSPLDLPTSALPVQ